MAGIARDEEIPVVSRDLVSRQEGRGIASSNVLEQERAISASVDVVTICTSADPAESAGRSSQSPRSISSDVVAEAQG